MKILTLISYLLLSYLFIFSSCKKDTNCRDNILGTYIGTIATAGAPVPITTKINVGNNEKDVLLTIIKDNQIFSTFSGNLNADCTVLDIPSQDIGTSINPLTVYGTLLIENETIKGSIIQPVGSPITINCSK